MNMNFIIDNSELVIAILGLAIALIALFSLKKTTRIIVSAVSIILSVFFIGVYYYSWQTVNVPYVEHTMYSTAQALLRQVGLREQIVSYNGGTINEADFLIWKQSPGAQTRVRKGDTIILYVKEPTQGEQAWDENVSFDSENFADVKISIDNYTVFTEGYRYEWVSDEKHPNVISSIEFDKGIYGTFSYSRDLLESELVAWGHSGILYNSDGDIVDEKDDPPSFWCISDGKFAVEFPDSLGSGKYIYELTVWIRDVQISDSIVFYVD